MKARIHSMPGACPETSPRVQPVQVEVSRTHPLLLLKQALPGEAITEVMTRPWRLGGTTVEGGPGLPWDVSWSVPVVVLMRIKGLDSRQRAADVAENGVARVCMGRPPDPQAPVRDHSTIARAYAARGTSGLDALPPLVLQEAQRCGFVDEGVLSADTTAQELPMGSPNAPGMWRGLAHRGGRALRRRKQRGVAGLESAWEQVQTIWRAVKEPHRFPAGKADKRAVLRRRLREVGALLVHTRPLVTRLRGSSDRVRQRARSRRMARHEVSKPLRGQIVPGLSTGKVAANTILPVGIPHARAIVRHKAGQKTALGLAYRLSRLGGGALCGERIAAHADERQMPLQALAGSRALCGPAATPEWVVYDRGGDATATRQRLALEGVRHVGIPPTGKRPWSGAEAVREQRRSARGRTAGSMGTVKSNRDHFNKPKERRWQTLEMAAPRSIWSFNLHKVMRDVVGLSS